MIDAHHARAVESGARIVHCCGFDSIPSDLSVLTVHDHLAKQGKRIAEAHYRLLRMKGKLDALLPKAAIQTAGVTEDVPVFPADPTESSGAHQ